MKRTPAPGASRFEFRSGFGDFRWKGQRTIGDPASNGPNRPRLLINTRGVGDGFRERAGLSEVNSTALQSSSACIVGEFDFPLATALKLWIQGDGCAGISSSVGFSLANIDMEQDPEFQRAIYYDTATNEVVLASFGGDLYVGVDSALKRIQLIQNQWGTENLAVSGSSQDTPIVTFSGFTIRCMQEFDGQLYIGLDNGAGASKIATFDGLSVRDDLTGINVPTCFGLYRIQNGGDALVVGFAAASAQVRIRPTGVSPGTWTTISGTVASVEMADFGDVLYIASGTADLYQLSGTTLSVARSPASATAINAVTADNGFLYFGYDTAAAGIIGKYDGSTWTDVEKNLTTQFTGTTSVRALAFYREYLYAGGIRSSAGQIWFAAGDSTSGSWTQFNTQSTLGDVNALLVA